MKATYKNIALAALALSAVACSQDEDFTSAYLSDPDAVRITAQVGNTSGGFTRSNPIGTEDEQKTFNSGDKIGVSAGSQAAVVYTLDADGKTWKPETDKYLKWESNPMNFTAWYPATDNTDDKNFTPSYNNTASSLAELQANDYMTYSGEQNNTNGNGVNLTMERQMVRIVISDIGYNDQYNKEENAVVAIAITSGNCKYEGGAWKDGNITAQMYKHSDNKWYAVFPPTATAKDNDTFLSITLNGEPKPLLTVKGIPATKPGKSYDYTLTVGKDVATIGSVSVTDWTDGTIPGGEAQETAAFEGKGTKEDPYQIRNANDLKLMGQLINTKATVPSGFIAYDSADAYYILTDNIDCTGVEWGDLSYGIIKTFNGNIDGGEYRIENMSITSTSWSRGFICNNYGTVKNIHFDNVQFKYIQGGGIVASNYGSVINCSIQGEIEAVGQYTGAVVSKNTADAVMIGCSFNGTFKTSQMYEALIASNNVGKIIGCYVSGDLILSDGNNWICGIAMNIANGSVIGCYNTAKFTPSGKAWPIVKEGTQVANYHKATITNGNSFINDGSTEIDGTTVTWASAVEAMNTAICDALKDLDYGNFKYVENTDEATKEAWPYVLKEIKDK